nr:hypothetical protein OG781_20210 [Streptomyces sp. NBC_00830]
MAAEDFELLDSQATTPGLPPFGQLDTVPEPALLKAQFFKRHLIEVETEVPPDALAGTNPRPEFDPKWRTINERITAKAAELTTSGTSVSDRTLHRMRLRWRDEGVWGLVDRRATRLSMPSTGRVDERLVEALIEVLAAQESKSTGTRTRVMRQAEQLVHASIDDLPDSQGRTSPPQGKPARCRDWRSDNCLRVAAEIRSLSWNRHRRDHSVTVAVIIRCVQGAPTRRSSDGARTGASASAYASERWLSSR